MLGEPDWFCGGVGVIGKSNFVLTCKVWSEVVDLMKSGVQGVKILGKRE